MFDASEGKKVFERLYKTVLEKNDPELWYGNGYSTWECWDYAADNAVSYLVDHGFGGESITDLMAYIIECNPNDIGNAFGNGFEYLLGTTMQNEYEMGE